MTLLLFITTAICLVGWIWTKVQLRTTAFHCNNAEEDLRVTQNSCNLCVDRYEILQGTLACVAEAVKEERTAMTHHIVLLKDKCMNDVRDNYDQHCRPYLEAAQDSTTRQQWASGHCKRLVQFAETCKSPEVTAFLDEFIAEHLPAETAEMEVDKFVDEFIAEHLPAETADTED